MGKGTVFENDFLKLVLNAVAIANIADNASASPLTNVFLSLHTADPSAGNQTTNEISYTGYTRMTVARTSGGWTIVGNSASPFADITFPTSGGGTGGTATYAAVGTLTTAGAGKVLWSGVLSPTITITNGTIPVVKAGSTIIET
jgi:hypothetical protein